MGMTLGLPIPGRGIAQLFPPANCRSEPKLEAAARAVRPVHFQIVFAAPAVLEPIFIRSPHAEGR
jgi:hypothetical protein